MTYPLGIDVSKWQASQDGTRVMDWQKAKSAGIQFAFVRASYGADYIDPQFAYNWQEVRRLGIPHGAYHYFRPLDDVKQQIDHFFLSSSSDDEYDYDWHYRELSVLDIEDTGGLSRTALTAKVKQAIERVYDLDGRYPLIYSRSSWLDANIDMAQLPKLDWWLAQYRWAYPYPLYTPEYPSELIAAPHGIERQQIKFHQSGERGNGGKYGAASHYIDTDRFLGTDAELAAYFGAANVPAVYHVYLPIVVKPEAPKPDHLEVEPFSQNDPRWKNNRLGTSDTTIGWNGCLITCVAMVARFYGYDTDPARLNTWLTANGGYSNGNLFNWYSTWMKVSTWEECLNIPAPLNKLDETLARGEPCIVWVDFNPATATMDMHWVVIIGKLPNDDYTMIDPWDGEVTSFKSRYKDAKRYIYRIVSYSRS